ncbi:hypothetical protein HDU97_006624 [Phlyctochytrium planicorne]|nr:hypothetical protein HDU97_006624 [Phlyctochytrium planicorne]
MSSRGKSLRRRRRRSVPLGDISEKDFEGSYHGMEGEPELETEADQEVSFYSDSGASSLRHRSSVASPQRRESVGERGCKTLPASNSRPSLTEVTRDISHSMGMSRVLEVDFDTQNMMTLDAAVFQLVVEQRQKDKAAKVLSEEDSNPRRGSLGSRIPTRTTTVHSHASKSAALSPVDDGQTPVPQLTRSKTLPRQRRASFDVSMLSSSAYNPINPTQEIQKPVRAGTCSGEFLRPAVHENFETLDDYLSPEMFGLTNEMQSGELARQGISKSSGNAEGKKGEMEETVMGNGDVGVPGGDKKELRISRAKTLHWRRDKTPAEGDLNEDGKLPEPDYGRNAFTLPRNMGRGGDGGGGGGGEKSDVAGAKDARKDAMTGWLKGLFAKKGKGLAI